MSWRGGAEGDKVPVLRSWTLLRVLTASVLALISLIPYPKFCTSFHASLGAPMHWIKSKLPAGVTFYDPSPP